MASKYRRQLEIPNISELSFEERPLMIVDVEWLSSENNRTERLFTGAKLREHANFADIDYDPRRKLDKPWLPVCRIYFGSEKPET